MIVHVVLFRPRADLSDVQRYESLMSEDMTCSAIVEFEDLEGLLAYLQHPAHEELGRVFMTSLEAACIFDYDMREGAGVRELLER